MSDALDGQAALDEANNEITRLRAKLAESERVIDFQREEMRAAHERRMSEDKKAAEIHRLTVEVETLKEQLHHLGSARDAGHAEEGRTMKVWIGRDMDGTLWVGCSDEPDVSDALGGMWHGGQTRIFTGDEARVLDKLGISLEPGEAHALELTALDYGWVMEEGSDE